MVPRLQGEIVPTARSTKRPRSGRAPLSRERIASAGLELADREGIEALSMRRLADELGAGPMTLYGHFADKRELLDAVVGTAIAGAQLPLLEGSWRDQVRRLVGWSRDLFARHPSVVEIWARQPVLGAGSLHSVEAGMRILEEAGFEPEEAVDAFRLVVTYTFGFTLFSTARATPEARDSARAAFETLSPADYPRLRAAPGAFAGSMGGEQAFAYGLERILDGLEARLAAG